MTYRPPGRAGAFAAALLSLYSAVWAAVSLIEVVPDAVAVPDAPLGVAPGRGGDDGEGRPGRGAGHGHAQRAVAQPAVPLAADDGRRHVG